MVVFTKRLEMFALHSDIFQVPKQCLTHDKCSITFSWDREPWKNTRYGGEGDFFGFRPVDFEVFLQYPLTRCQMASWIQRSRAQRKGCYLKICPMFRAGNWCHLCGWHWLERVNVRRNDQRSRREKSEEESAWKRWEWLTKNLISQTILRCHYNDDWKCLLDVATWRSLVTLAKAVLVQGQKQVPNGSDLKSE